MGYQKGQGVTHKYEGTLRPQDVKLLSNQVQKAIFELERSIATATKGIDPSRTQDIEFAVNNMVAKWVSGEEPMPKNLHQLNLVLRETPTTKSRSLQIGSFLTSATSPGHWLNRATGRYKGSRLSISGRADFTKHHLFDLNSLVSNPQGIYESLEKLNKLHRTLFDIQGTKYARNLDANILSEFNLKLDAQSSHTGINSYYNSKYDLSLKGQHIIDYETAREEYKTEFSDQYKANPGLYRTNLDPQNYWYFRGKGKTTSEDGSQYGPLNTLQGQYKKGDIKGDWRKGTEIWHRGSGRSRLQANADTRALLIRKGADPTQVKYLDTDLLSRFRISGALESKNNIQLLNDGGRNVTLKLNKNRRYNTTGGYGVTNDDSSSSISTVLPKQNLTIKNNEPKPENKGFLQKLSESFDEAPE